MSPGGIKSRYAGRRHSSNSNLESVHMQFSSMFHACQESSTLFNEFMRRNIECFEQRRQADDIHGSHLAQKPRQLPRHPLPTKIRLTMEVQGSDFSSLHDGREAWTTNDSLSDIMCDTDCLIQFADQHDESTENMGIFNQVTIVGDLPNIDHAMNRIRAFCPITVAVPLKNVREEFENKDLAFVIRQLYAEGELRKFSKVQFSILYPPNPFTAIQNDESNSMSLVVRASRKDSKVMSTACDAIVKLLFPENSTQIFYASLEIPSSQRRMIVGSPEGVLIRAISTSTKCTIHFPSSEKSPATYYLNGSAASVIEALRVIQDISPVRIEFEVENHHLSQSLTCNEDHRELDQFDIERGVIVQLRKSPYEGSFRSEHEGMRHSLTLMTSEENISNLYQIRQQLLVESCCELENIQYTPTNRTMPRFLEYLKVLVMESSMRAYIGEGKVISVCRCRNQQQQQPGNDKVHLDGSALC